MQKVARCANLAWLDRKHLPTHIIACWPFLIHLSPARLPPDETTVDAVSLHSAFLTPAVRGRVSGLSRLKYRETGGYNEQIRQTEGEEYTVVCIVHMHVWQYAGDEVKHISVACLSV